MGLNANITGLLLVGVWRMPVLFFQDSSPNYYAVTTIMADGKALAEHVEESNYQSPTESSSEKDQYVF